jgi:Flp pilus assembly protein TadG
MTLRNILKNSSGNVAIIFSLALVPLLGAAGVAVDMVNFNRVETMMQAAADAAALAGGTSKTLGNAVAMNKVVDDYLRVNNAYAYLAGPATVAAGIDPATGAFKVSVAGVVNTSLLGVVGMSTMPVAANSAVSLGIQGLEVALVLDNTGSMSGTKIASLKTAAKNLVKILSDAKADYTDLKFGLIPFSKYVNVGPGNWSASWVQPPLMPMLWNGCAGSRNAPLDEQVGVAGGDIPAVEGGVCPTPIVPLTSDTFTINSNIDAMIANGNTYIAGGVYWGWNVLDSSVPFTEGKTAAQMAAINGRKVMVVMTDGTNTASPLYPSHDGSDSAFADAKFSTMCASVKADNIEVYTVLFEEPSPVIKDLMRNCASAPDKFFDATSNAALITSFEDIGRKLADVRLVQ